MDEVTLYLEELMNLENGSFVWSSIWKSKDSLLKYK